MMSYTCRSFIIPISPCSSVWSMLHAPGLAGVVLFAAIAVEAPPNVANATTSEIVVISLLLIAFLLPFVVVTSRIPGARLSG
jgi:hypothetical protein